MSSRVLAYGLGLNALALAGLVALGLAVYLTSIYGWWFGSRLVGQILWGLFLAGSLLCWVGSPKGARKEAGLLVAMTVVSGYLLFSVPGPDRFQFGGLCALLSLLIYCVYQGTLAKQVHDLTSMALIKRAYDRPMGLFLGAGAVGGLCVFTEFFLPMPFVVVILVGCPLWSFAYLGVVTVQLIKAVRQQPTDGPSSGGPSGF